MLVQTVTASFNEFSKPDLKGEQARYAKFHRARIAEALGQHLALPEAAEISFRPVRLAPDWDGSLRAAGSLTFKSAAGRNKALAAFDANAYTEFFGRESWTVEPKSASLDLDLKLPVDCVGFERAFEAAVEHAVDGSIELWAGNLHQRYVAGGAWVERLA